MFSITVQGETLVAFHANLQQLADQFGGEPTASREQPKATGRKRAAAPAPEPDAEPADAVDAELLEEVPPAPNQKAPLVDAGTGQPIPKADAPIAGTGQPIPKADAPSLALASRIPKADAPIQMTMDQVRTNAAKLAAKDSPTLKAILNKYSAGKLSEVANDQLPAFAADVMQALS